MGISADDFEVASYRGYGIGCEVVDVSPEVARGWLEKKYPNRKPKPQNIKRFSKSMTDGRWALGPTLLFTKDWRLLDGQNRLYAVIAADMSVLFICVYGVPETSFAVVDDRQQRTASDVLEIIGEKETKKISSVIRFVNSFDEDPKSANKLSAKRSTLTNDMVPELADKYKDVWDVCRNDGLYRKFPRYTVLLSCMYIFNRIDKEMSEYFFNKLATGENLIKGNPIHLLRERLLSLRATRHMDVSSNMVYALVVKAWNAYRQGRSIGVLKWLDTEELPLPR